MKGRKLLFLIPAFSLFFTVSCGLDNFYYLDSPFSDGHSVSYTNSDAVQDYFSCVTNEEAGTGGNNVFFGSASDFTFLGTEIYYKIYNNYNKMISVESSVSSMVTSSSSYTAAAEYLLHTAGYKPLALSYGSISPLIKAGSSPQNKYVYIRLSPYGTDVPYQAGICVSTTRLTEYDPDSALKFNGHPVYPRRYGSSFGFNFSSSDVSSNPVPSQDDSDVTYSSTESSSGTWYVDMYAITVGRDTSYSLSYSHPYLMGSVAITVAD